MNRRGALRKFLGLGAGTAVAVVAPVALLASDEEFVPDAAPDCNYLNSGTMFKLRRLRGYPPEPRAYEPTGDEADFVYDADGHLWLQLTKSDGEVIQKKLI